MKIIDEILKIEQESNLFDIENKQGLKVWEAIRYCVNTQILRHTRPILEHSKRSNNSTYLFSLKRMWNFFLYSVTHYRRNTLLILCSRSITQDQYCDIIMDELYGISNKKDIFVIETSFNWDKNNYKYGKVCPSLTTLVMRLLKTKYDFSEILYIMKKSFPYVEFDVDEIDSYYNLFVSQYRFYNLFFKLFRFKKVFFVQNGICKGLIAAAKKNKVSIMELQHGQISRNHFAYSYPQGINIALYNPDYLLTFGPLWLKDSTFPDVNVLPIGNNFYCYKYTDVGESKKNILVVSSVIHYKQLRELVKNISTLDSSFHFFYKLHPDEYKTYNEYVDFFYGVNNVEVIKNEQSISELIYKSDLSLVVQSTVMVETLNAGKRVFVYRVLDYEVMDFLYQEPGISFVDDARSFIEKYINIGDVDLPVGRFFMPFDKETATKLLN